MHVAVMILCAVFVAVDLIRRRCCQSAVSDYCRRNCIMVNLFVCLCLHMNRSAVSLKLYIFNSKKTSAKQKNLCLYHKGTK